MRTRLLAAAASLAALAACSQNRPAPTGPAPSEEPPPPPPTVAIERPSVPAREGSTIALGRVGGRKLAFLADEDTSSVRTIDLGAAREIASLPLGGRPTALVVTRGGRLAVALRDDAAVAILAAHADGSLALASKTTTEKEPRALALSPDDATLYVVTGWTHALEAFPIREGGLGDATLDVPVAREPRAVSIASDGKRAFVSHAAASTLEEVDLAEKATARTIDLGIPGQAPRVLRIMHPDVMLEALIPVEEHADPGAFDDGGFPLPARFARQAYALARVTVPTAAGPRETFVAPHTEVMTGDPMVISSGYGGGGMSEIDEPAERFALSWIDAKDGRRLVLSKEGDARDKTGCHLPRAAASDAAGNVYVACFGSDALMAFWFGEKSYVEELGPDPEAKLVVDRNGFMVQKALSRRVPYLATAAKGRVAVPAGPNGVAFDPDEKRLVAFSQLAGAVSIVDADAFASKRAPTVITLVRSSGLDARTARGRSLFYSGGDPRIAKDGRACSSCHPEGRDDGLVWSTPDGPRQTILLAGRENRSGPFGWRGAHATLQIHMQSTMKNLAGTGLDAADQDALAAFLRSLPAAPEPWRALTPEESRGRDVFASSDAQCASCHEPKSGFTDHDTHDVRSATAADQSREFLVPSLAGVGGSAPYFHDGRYASLEDLLEKCDGTMGSTKQMTGADKRALAAYLRTL